MATTCRTCRFASPRWWCISHMGHHQFHGRACDTHKRRETPLLVDELAKALTRVLQQFSEEGWPTISVAVLPGTEEHGATWGSFPVDDETRDAIRHSGDILARYKEEVGDA